MEYLLEFLVELIFELGIEGSQNPKVPKFIRYTLIILIVLFYLLIFGLIFICGVIALKSNKTLGIFLLLIDIFLITMSIIKFSKIYLKKRGS